MALHSALNGVIRRATSSNSCTSAAELVAAAAVVAVAVAPAQAFAFQPAAAVVPAAPVPASVVPDAAVPGAFVPPAAVVAAAAAAGPENFVVASEQRKGLLLMHAAVAKQAGNWMGLPKRHHQKQALGLGSGHLAR